MSATENADRSPVEAYRHTPKPDPATPWREAGLCVLDLETTDGKSVEEVNAWAKAWLAHVKAKTGATPIFYSGWYFADTSTVRRLPTAWRRSASCATNAVSASRSVAAPFSKSMFTPS